MNGHSVRVILRALVLSCFLAPAVAIAQPVGVNDTGYQPAIVTSTFSGNWALGTNGAWVLDTSGAAVTGTSGSMRPGMKPGVPAAAQARHPYFFAAYAAVWLGLLAYIAWLATRIKSLEEALSHATDRSR